jgi:hypothetical protein
MPNKGKVDCDAMHRDLVIGGYAVAYNGHVRYTGDLDIFVELSTIFVTRCANA